MLSKYENTYFNHRVFDLSELEKDSLEHISIQSNDRIIMIVSSDIIDFLDQPFSAIPCSGTRKFTHDLIEEQNHFLNSEVEW